MTGTVLHHKYKHPTSIAPKKTIKPPSKQLQTDDMYDLPVGIATDRGVKLNQEVRLYS